MPCTGNLGQLVKNVAAMVEANTLHGICPSSGINLIAGNWMVVLPFSLELL